ncbi:MAG: ABC transporter ATP-binding protein [Oscillospiraceae bacterium]|nr:ABC transporter ATP-binding protein [Oscillospiraceae bacterium]
MLKVIGLEKSYKNLQVLKGLNMTIEKGDIYGFLGTNGCGKTTTMNIICNIIRKDGGVIDFDGENTRIGYLPEAPELYGFMNGFEYLDYIAACSEYSGDIKARTEEVLRATGMYNDAPRLIKGYSRGMNQRIGIAAALYANPDLLILDEPTSALDPEGRAEVIEIIGALAKSGSTIILCTHILSDVERVANKIGILRDGVMVVEGALAKIKSEYADANAVTVRFRQNTDISAAKSFEVVERSKTESSGDVTFYAKDGVSEAELFYKIVTALGTNQIVPEGIWFRRMSLEQVYLGISGTDSLSYESWKNRKG